jgi:hypothetical protein
LHFYYLSFCGLLICGGHVANNRHFKTRVYWHCWANHWFAMMDLIVSQISRHGEDFVCWPHSKHGLYTVRSAYNLARSESFFVERSIRGRGMSSTSAHEEKMWKSIWKIKAPSKMKIHL